MVIIDQTALPETFRTLRLETVDELIEAIRRLAVRGAPALGAAGALGVALSARRHGTDSEPALAAVRAEAGRDETRAARNGPASAAPHRAAPHGCRRLATAANGMRCGVCAWSEHKLLRH